MPLGKRQNPGIPVAAGSGCTAGCWTTVTLGGAKPLPAVKSGNLQARPAATGMTADYRTSVGDGFLLPSAILGSAVVPPLCLACPVTRLCRVSGLLNGAGFNSHLSGHLTGRSSRYWCRPRFFARHRCTSCGAGRDISPAIATSQERTIRAFFVLVNTPLAQELRSHRPRHHHARVRVHTCACTGSHRGQHRGQHRWPTPAKIARLPPSHERLIILN